MRKLAVIMTIVSLGFTSCNMGESKGYKTETPVEQETPPDTHREAVEKVFIYSEARSKETVRILLTEDEKEVLSGTHTIDGSDTHPITFLEVEFDRDMGFFIGRATSLAWEGEAMVGIEGDFSKLSLNDGKIKKVFVK